VRPFVVAINSLLARVAQSMEAQRRFVADAAHELRTHWLHRPLLRKGIERDRNLLNQLLTFARTQSFGEPSKSSVSIQGVYRRVLEDVMPLAAAKHSDVGVEGTTGRIGVGKRAGPSHNG
jgi:two-component system, OmpR family, sensor kinase